MAGVQVAGGGVWDGVRKKGEGGEYSVNRGDGETLLPKLPPAVS